MPEDCCGIECDVMVAYLSLNPVVGCFDTKHELIQTGSITSLFGFMVGHHNVPLLNSDEGTIAW